jgi:hypothetical protein
MNMLLSVPIKVIQRASVSSTQSVVKIACRIARRRSTNAVAACEYEKSIGQEINLE